MMNLCMPLLKGESAEDKIGPAYPFLRVTQTVPPVQWPAVIVFDFSHNLFRFNDNAAIVDFDILDTGGNVLESIHIPLCKSCPGYNWDLNEIADAIAYFRIDTLVNVDNMIIPLKVPAIPKSPNNWNYYANYLRFGIDGEGIDRCSMSFMTSCIEGVPNASKSKLVSVLNNHMKDIARRWGSAIFKNVNDYAIFTESNTIEPNLYSGGIIMCQNAPLVPVRYYRFYTDDEPYNTPGSTYWNHVITLRDYNGSGTPQYPLLTGAYHYNAQHLYNNDQDDLLLYLSLIKSDYIDSVLRKINTRYFYR